MYQANVSCPFIVSHSLSNDVIQCSVVPRFRPSTSILMQSRAGGFTARETLDWPRYSPEQHSLSSHSGSPPRSPSQRSL